MCLIQAGRERDEDGDGNLAETLWSCFFCFFLSLTPRDVRRRVGKSYLEGVLKEIHVGINPDIMSAHPPHTSLHMCCLVLTADVMRWDDWWMTGEGFSEENSGWVIFNAHLKNEGRLEKQTRSWTLWILAAPYFSNVHQLSALNLKYPLWLKWWRGLRLLISWWERDEWRDIEQRGSSETRETACSGTMWWMLHKHLGNVPGPPVIVCTCVWVWEYFLFCSVMGWPLKALCH